MKSPRTILTTPIRIPWMQRCSKVVRMPWVLRRCPDGKRNSVAVFFAIIGSIVYVLVIIAGLMSIFIAPLWLAAQHPDAPIAYPIRWLISHFSKDTAMLIYAIISIALAWLLLYLILVFDYLRYEVSEKQKLEHQDRSIDPPSG